jgi:GDP-mannose 6-dehydrogenase
MKVNMYGLGYVGCVTAACLASDGHEVLGIDIDPLKVDMINAGKSPIREPGLEEKIAAAIACGRLRASRDGADPADVSLVCVGTPSRENGGQDLSYLLSVARQLGDFLGRSSGYHVINVRSTVMPGTVEEVFVPAVEQRSGKRRGADFGVCMNPEFLRESTSITDFYNPPFTVIGQLDERSGDVVAGLYGAIDATVYRTSIRSAEMLKYVCNSFHALKVTFANEVGVLCKQLGADSRAVMALFAEDRKLNISGAYLRPGFAFGGSCLPKDLRALTHCAKEHDLETPLLSSLLRSNAQQVDRAFDLIRRTGKKRVAVLGLSFKPGTDDLRESPLVELIEKLLGKGYTVRVFDPEVSYARLYGANKRYIEKVIPHVSQLLSDSIESTLDGAEVVVLGSATEGNRRAAERLDGSVCVIDLVSLVHGSMPVPPRYEGICW